MRRRMLASESLREALLSGIPGEKGRSVSVDGSNLEQRVELFEKPPVHAGEARVAVTREAMSGLEENAAENAKICFDASS